MSFDDRNREEYLEERQHRRRIALMNAMGETNRLERRMYIGFAIAGVLAVLAFILMWI